MPDRLEDEPAGKVRGLDLKVVSSNPANRNIGSKFSNLGQVNVWTMISRITCANMGSNPCRGIDNQLGKVKYFSVANILAGKSNY